MKKLFVVLLVLAVASMPALAQVDSWSDLPSDFQPPVFQPAPPSPVGPPTEAQTFYNDRATFQAAAPPLTTEDFTGTLVPPNGVLACISPLNSSTNDACFPTGGVVDGFEMAVILIQPPPDDYVVATTGFLGAPFEIVGPNTFGDDTALNFVPPVNAVGFDLVALLGPLTVDVSIYDAGGVLLTTTTATSSTIAGEFWGVISDEPIGSIELSGQGGAEAELIGNLEFGVALNVPVMEIPTAGIFGLGLLLALLAGTGVFALRRRR